MRLFIKRIIGTGLVVIAALSLVITLLGLIPLWRIRRPLTARLLAGADLLLATLDTTGNALSVIEGGLHTASENVIILENTTLAVAQTISNTRPIVDSAGRLIGQELAAPVVAVRATLRSAQSGAKFVDDFLGALAKLPVINASYQPAVTLSDSLGHVADSLDHLPASLSGIEHNLDATGDSLDAAAGHFVALAKAIERIRLSLAQAQGVVDEYQEKVTRFRALVRSLRAATPGAITAGAIALTFLILWLAAVQVGALLKGWEWMRGKVRGGSRGR